ncbi:MAG: DUF2029 domain-containing protein [Chloroflexi bacterium]|nr:DUF2029 domain-containing protein [Chloroflexota bacterium]
MLTTRNLCLMAAGLALVYVAATLVSYSRILGGDATIDDGVIGGDYAAFYAAGGLVLHGQADHLYDAQSVHAVQQAAIQGRVPDLYVAYRNPAFFALVMAPFAALDLLPSFAVWTLASVGLIVTAIRLTLRTTPSVRAHWKLVALAVGGFLPVYSGLVDGQNAAVSLMLYVLVYLALRDGRDAHAGAWAALGLFKPQLFFVLPLVFVASRRWRALRAYAVVTGALAAISVALVGLEGLLAWARIIVDYEPANAAKLAPRMYSLKSFFDLLLPEQKNLALGLTLICSLAVLALVMRVWMAHDTSRHELRFLWTLTMLAALLVDPHLVDYDLTVLILPGLLLLGALPEAVWWMCGLFLLTMIDAPLGVGDVGLQLSVVLLAGLAIRIWRHIEHGRRLSVTNFTLHGVYGGARAA